MRKSSAPGCVRSLALLPQGRDRLADPRYRVLSIPQLIGIFLDCNMPRRLRAWGGWLAVLALLFAAYGGNYAVQKTYTRASVVAEGFEAV